MPSRRILFISNGHGEDSIAAEIIRRLPPSILPEAYPTLGSGRELARVAQLVGPRAELNSQGGRHRRFSLTKDILSGGLLTITPGVRFLRRVRKHYDHVVVIGDMVGVIGCYLAGIRGITYVDVYRTGFARGYMAVELGIIKRTCARVFSRHEALAASLRAAGVEVITAGNVMMDAIPYGQYDAKARRERQAGLLLLPGSRVDANANFALQVEALTHLRQSELPDLFLALADGVDPHALAAGAGLRYQGPMTAEMGDGGTMTGPIAIHVGRGVLGNLIDATDIVMSQAGTATLQSIGQGRPVITVQGPRSRASRRAEIGQMYGEARQLLPPDPAEIAMALSFLLGDPTERARRSEIGRERIGGQGAVDAIIAAISGEAAEEAVGNRQ